MNLSSTGTPQTTIITESDSWADYPVGHDLSNGFAIFAATCFSLIILFSVICNAILIYTIVSVKKLHSVTHVFIINLAISDLITAIGTVPFDVDYMLQGLFTHGKFACGIMQTTFLVSLPSSVFNLCLLTGERLITVRFPFHHMEYLTKPKVAIAVVSTWSYTLLVAFFPLMLNPNTISVEGGVCFMAVPFEFDIFQLVVNFMLPIIFICFANIVLFCISNKQASKIKQSTYKVVSHNENNNTTPKRQIKVSFTNGVAGDNTDGTVKLRKTSKNTSRTRRVSLQPNSIKFIANNMKAAKRIAMLVGVFLFCWLTFIILVATNIACGICHPRELTWIGNIINYSSAAINPILYGMFNRRIRQEVLKKARKLCIRFRNSSYSPRGKSEFLSEYNTTKVEYFHKSNSENSALL